MPRIDDLSDAAFMKLQAEDSEICTLEDVWHLLLELVAGDAVSDENCHPLVTIDHRARSMCYS